MFEVLDYTAFLLLQPNTTPLRVKTICMHNNTANTESEKRSQHFYKKKRTLIGRICSIIWAKRAGLLLASDGNVWLGDEMGKREEQRPHSHHQQTQAQKQWLRVTAAEIAHRNTEDQVAEVVELNVSWFCSNGSLMQFLHYEQRGKFSSIHWNTVRLTISKI